jgi:rubrerythrin
MEEQDKKDLERIEAQENKERYFIDRYKEPNTECGKCGYTWYYKGSSSKPTCPGCQYKVSTNTTTT